MPDSLQRARGESSTRVYQYLEIRSLVTIRVRQAVLLREYNSEAGYCRKASDVAHLLQCWLKSGSYGGE